MSNFQELLRGLEPTKRIPQNFDPGGLRSGQFCSLTIITLWENVQMLFIGKYEYERVNYLKIFSYYTTLDDSFAVLANDFLPVIRVHMGSNAFFASNF